MILMMIQLINIRVQALYPFFVEGSTTFPVVDVVVNYLRFGYIPHKNPRTFYVCWKYDIRIFTQTHF